MCDCSGNDGPAVQHYNGPSVNTSLAESVTIDILQMYRIPISCVNQHLLYEKIDSTAEEVNDALSRTDAMISSKLINSSYLVDIDDFNFVKTVAFKAISKNICK